MNKILPLLLVSVIISASTGCNTISGAGKDISAAGHDVTKAAKKVQQTISN